MKAVADHQGKARERCLALLEVRRILTQLWIDASTDFERQEIEECLAGVRRMLVRLCEDAGIPIDV